MQSIEMTLRAVASAEPVADPFFVKITAGTVGS